jgi:hypothetical protein
VNELFKPGRQHVYRLTYGWRGMPPRTELVDLERPVEIGMQIKVAEQWWFVERISPPRLGERHEGHIEASPAR